MAIKREEAHSAVGPVASITTSRNTVISVVNRVLTLSRLAVPQDYTPSGRAQRVLAALCGVKTSPSSKWLRCVECELC
jgi:hypothetical protein